LWVLDSVRGILFVVVCGIAVGGIVVLCEVLVLVVGGWWLCGFDFDLGGVLVL
jgi:hypothetical protein